MGIIKTRLERMVRFEIKDSGCWEWFGAKDNQGYGRIGPQIAHRVFYEEFCGPIPEGMFILHKCDNPKCVNPDHLFVGTHQDNVNDKMNKNRHFSGNGRQGREFGTKRKNHKITDEDVRYIRNNPDNLTGEQLRSLFGLSSGRISDIRNRKAWTHVE